MKLNDSIAPIENENDTNIVTPEKKDENLPNANQNKRKHETREPQPGSSRDCDSLPLKTKLEELAPIPRIVLKTLTNNSRPKKHSEILTSTPLKEQLEIAREKRNQKEEKKEKKIKGAKECKNNEQKKRKLSLTRKTSKQTTKKPCHVRNLHLADSDSDSNSSYDESAVCDGDELDDVDPTNTYICLVCGEFGQNGELWYRCTLCANWSHAECSGWNSPKAYICDMCLGKK